MAMEGLQLPLQLLLEEVSGERKLSFKENHYCKALKELQSMRTSWLCSQGGTFGLEPGL